LKKLTQKASGCRQLSLQTNLILIITSPDQRHTKTQNMKIKPQSGFIWTIVTLTIFYTVVIGLIAISYLAKDEGTIGDGILLNFLADYLYFLAFPMFVFMAVFAKAGIGNILYMSIAALLTGLTYAITTWFLYAGLRRFIKFSILNG